MSYGFRRCREGLTPPLPTQGSLGEGDYWKDPIIVSLHLSCTSQERGHYSPSWCSRRVLQRCIPSHRCCLKSPPSLHTPFHLKGFPTVSSTVWFHLSCTSQERGQNSPSWCSRQVHHRWILSRRCCPKSPLPLLTQIHLKRYPTVESTVRSH